MHRLTDILGRWLGFCALALAMASTPASRGQSVVTLCTQQELEARIAEARDLSGDGLITFECDGVIVLTNTIVLPFSLLEIETDDYGESVTNETELLSELTLDGTGRFVAISGPVTTNATNGVRLFLVDSGVTLSLININLVNGQSTNGGAVYVRTNGVLLASGCVFSNNVAITADGLDGTSAPTGTVGGTARDGRSGGSVATAAGGAICNFGFAEILGCSFLTNGVVGGNGGNGGNGGSGTVSAGDGGGGGRGGSALGGAIYNQNTLHVFVSRFFDNTANGGFGGSGGTAGTGPFAGFDGHGGSGGATAGAAIYNHLKSRTVMANSTFGFNVAASGDSAGGGSSSRGRGKKGPTGPNSSGGAIANLGTNVLVNCSFFANLVVGGQGGDGGAGRVQGGNGGSGGVAYGGNIFNGGRRGLTLATNCTFSDGGAIAGTNGLAGTGPFPARNGAKGVSRGGNVANSNGVFHLKNCLIAYASPGTNGYGAFKDAGFNFSSDRSIKLNRKLGSITNADPRLDILRANGGPVETMELLSGSRAIDAGDTNFILSIDARGVSRPLGARGDIGAYEAGVILGPPRIVTQPVNQMAREGATVVFTVVAEGDAPLLYQWRKDGVDIDDETSPALTLSLVDEDSDGEYDVEISNNSGTVTSDSATLTLVGPPEITEDLADESIDLGGSLVLSVTATGDAPLIYTWLTNGVVALGATLDTFTINNATNKDDMDYQVIVCNPYGCTTSSVAHVTVALPSPPAIQTQPVGTNVFSGETATFTVGHTGTFPRSYQWFFNGSLLAGAVNQSLVVANAQSANVGSYHLVITNISGSVTSAAAALAVSDSAPILMSQSGDVEQDVGTAATFSVAAVGSKPMTFQWYQTTIDSSGNPTGTIALTNGVSATLVIPSLAVEHEGTYKCVVSNSFGTLSSDVVFLTEIFCNVRGVGVSP